MSPKASTMMMSRTVLNRLINGLANSQESTCTIKVSGQQPKENKRT